MGSSRRRGLACAVLLALPAIALTQAPAQPAPGFTNLRAFLPLAHARFFGDAELTLLNNGPQPVNTTLRWLVRDRGFVEGLPIIAEPHTPQFRMIHDLLPQGVELPNVDGLEVSYQGRAVMHVSAQVTLLPTPQSQLNQSLDVPPTIPVDVRGPRLEAVWAIPRRDEQAVIEILNLSDSPRSVTVTRPGETRQLSMEPSTAQLLTFPAAPSRLVDWVRLEGNQSGLRATGFVMSASDGIPHLIRFYDPKAAAQTDVWANGVRLGDPSLAVLLKNTLDVAVRAKAELFDPKDGRVLADCPSIDLGAGAASALDLRPIAGAALTTRTAALRVNSFGSTGSIVGAVQTIDAATGLQHDAPLRDSAWDNTSYRRGTGNCAWRIDGDYETRLTITNVGDADTGYIVVFRANQTEYIGGRGTLAVGASAAFDLRYMRDQQIKDTSRRTLPADADRGQCHWSVASLPGMPNSRSRLMGRAEVISVSRRVSSTHSW
jgi:hypothetical protein